MKVYVWNVVLILGVILIVSSLSFSQDRKFEFIKGEEASQSGPFNNTRIENVIVSYSANETTHLPIIVSDNVRTFNNELVLTGPLLQLPE